LLLHSSPVPNERVTDVKGETRSFVFGFVISFGL
jgi:hypothetical protein